MFADNFLWGASAAAHQVEGAYNEDGKGMGIWDTFTQEPKYIAHGENGNVACDHYHHYKEDVRRMKEMGLKCYRFSVSWPRVLPEGVGEVNEKGLAFYSNLVDELLDAGIEPMLTLYHWNLPTAIYEKDGWKNPESVTWFEQYVELITKTFAGRVHYWITFNEPQLFVGGGLQAGFHAPFEYNDTQAMMGITRNILLAHGRAVSVIRKNCGADTRIGLAPTAEVLMPKSRSVEEIETARRITFSTDPEMFLFQVAWWSDPIFKGTYSKEAQEVFGEQLPRFTTEEWESISQELDFYGFNIYQAGLNPVPGNPLGYDRYSSQGSPKTALGWNITPDIMYWCCRFFYERYQKPLLVTENGMACFDFESLDGKVHDPARIDFTHRYLRSLKQATEEGIPVLGYCHWSLMDNYEWTDGYDKRFGLIYIDYKNQKRIMKDSAYWYRDVIERNGENL